MGFSLTSPDLVICTGSPDIPINRHGDSPTFFKNEFLKNVESSIDISLERGINALEEIQGAHETPPAKISTSWKTPNEDVFLEASFELPPPPLTQESLFEDLPSAISTNEDCRQSPEVPIGEAFHAIENGSPPSKLKILQ